MTETGKNLILGRLGRTRQTHAGSPTVLVERTMDDAASRTGIVPDHHPEDEHPESHESVSHHVTGRLGLRPAQEQEACQDQAHLPRKAQSRQESAEPAPQLNRPFLDSQVQSQEGQDQHSPTPKAARAYSDHARKQTHRKLTNTLKQLDLFHPDEHREVHAEDEGHEREAQAPVHPAHSDEPTQPSEPIAHVHRASKHRVKKRRRRRRKACHHKSTFRLCSRTLRCLKAYSRITGRWQYNLVGEALESYLELAITSLDPESLRNMRAILHELHHKKPAPKATGKDEM
jgi:hypothetical protein